MKKRLYPNWICFDCGARLGKSVVGICTSHEGTCDVCGKENISVTEPRDFNHLVDDWENIVNGGKL